MAFGHRLVDQFVVTRPCEGGGRQGVEGGLIDFPGGLRRHFHDIQIRTALRCMNEGEHLFIGAPLDAARVQVLREAPDAEVFFLCNVPDGDLVDGAAPAGAEIGWIHPEAGNPDFRLRQLSECGIAAALHEEHPLGGLVETDGWRVRGKQQVAHHGRRLLVA